MSPLKPQPTTNHIADVQPSTSRPPSVDPLAELVTKNDAQNFHGTDNLLPPPAIVPSEQQASPDMPSLEAQRVQLAPLPLELKLAVEERFPMQHQDYQRILVRCLCRFFLADRLTVAVPDLNYALVEQQESPTEGLARLLESSGKTTLAQVLKKAQMGGLTVFVENREDFVELAKDFTPKGLIYRSLIKNLRNSPAFDHPSEVWWFVISRQLRSSTNKRPIFKIIRRQNKTEHILAAAEEGVVVVDKGLTKVALAAAWRKPGPYSGGARVGEEQRSEASDVDAQVPVDEQQIRHLLACCSNKLDALHAAELAQVKSIFVPLIKILQTHLAENCLQVSPETLVRGLNLDDGSYSGQAGRLGLTLHLFEAINAGLVRDVSTGSDAEIMLMGWEKGGVRQRFWDAKEAWNTLEKRRALGEGLQKQPTESVREGQTLEAAAPVVAGR